MTRTLGVDVGGTKVAAGLVDTSAGTIEELRTIPSDVAAGGFLARCVALCEELAAAARPAAIGVGLCEFVDLDGRPSSEVTFPAAETRFAEALAHLGAVTVESDVRAAALAEATFGAGRGVAAPWLYVTVGTGVSHCLVLDGRPYAGARGDAIVTGAPPIESWASGPAIARLAHASSAEQAFADRRHDDVVAEAAALLGATLAVLVNALDPALVVLGGGLGLEERYRVLTAAALHRCVDRQTARALPVVPAGLGYTAGVVGAALVAVGPS